MDFLVFHLHYMYFAAMITEHIRVLVETRKCVQKADNEEFYLEPIVSQS